MNLDFITLKTLYIIGNGFDLYHGLDTSYYSFALFLKLKYNKLYSNLTQYYTLPEIDEDESDEEKKKKIKAQWNQFEAELAGLDFETILDENTNYIPDISSDEYFSDIHAFEQEISFKVNELTIDLFDAFKQFILNVKFPSNIINKQINIQEDSAILSFNYTDTLEQYYGIPESRILYIHNKAKLSEVLVLGHSKDVNPMHKPEPKMPEGLSDENQQMWEEQQSSSYNYSYETGKAQLSFYFDQSYKHTKEILAEKKPFFESLNEIEQVIVLGHSMSDVDLPYFSHLKTVLPKNIIKWKISWFNAEEREYKTKVLTEMGVPLENIELIRIGDLLHNR